MYRELLQLIKKDRNLSWLYTELVNELSIGVTKTIKEVESDPSFFRLEQEENLSQQDRKKRNNYETTRDYNESEKTKIILEAIKKIFIEIPAIEKTTFKNLNKIDSGIESIIFHSDENEDIELESSTFVYTRNEVDQNMEMYGKKYKLFLESFNNEY